MNLKKAAQKKLKKSGGFTLVEMLIVVAIIAILVVVSIPMVSSSLDSAKEATDAANERAAKAAAMIDYMTKNLSGGEVYYYDAASGAVIPDSKTGIEGYNQMKKGDDGSISKDGAVLEVTVGTDGTVGADGVKWVEKG